MIDTAKQSKVKQSKVNGDWQTDIINSPIESEWIVETARQKITHCTTHISIQLIFSWIFFLLFYAKAAESNGNWLACHNDHKPISNNETATTSIKVANHVGWCIATSYKSSNKMASKLILTQIAKQFAPISPFASFFVLSILNECVCYLSCFLSSHNFHTRARARWFQWHCPIQFSAHYANKGRQTGERDTRIPSWLSHISSKIENIFTFNGKIARIFERNETNEEKRNYKWSPLCHSIPFDSIQVAFVVLLLLFLSSLVHIHTLLITNWKPKPFFEKWFVLIFTKEGHSICRKLCC